MDRILERLLNASTSFAYDAAADKGGGATSVTVDWPEDVMKGFKSLLSKEGSERDAAMRLYEENYEHRQEIRKLKDQIENKVILDDEEAKKYNALKELGDPEELKKKIEAGEEAIGKVSRLELEKSRSEVAEIHGYNPKVLDRLAGEDLKLEKRTRKKDDGTVEEFAVVKTDEKEIPLTDYAEQNWKEFMPSLTASTEGSGDKRDNGREFPEQGSTNTGKAGDDPVAARIARNQKARGLETEKT